MRPIKVLRMRKLLAGLITAFFGGNWAIDDNLPVTPVNPTHNAGDTLLCVAMIRWGGATLSVSGTGWTDATGFSATQAFGNSSIRFFMLECTGSSHANPTITPSGAGVGGAVIASVWRISGRAFGSPFTMGTVSSNASNTTTIALAQNSPSIGVGDMVLAIGLKENDGGTGNWNTISGQTAGLTWLAGPEFNSAFGFDESGVMIGAINNSGSAYTAGTGASITGRALSAGASSSAVYLKIAR